MKRPILTLILLFTGICCSSRLLAAHPLEGIWEQHLFADGEWLYGGQYELVAEGDALRMNIVSQPLDPELVSSQGLSNVRFENGEWSFDSDWGDYGIARFRLEADSEDLYIGHPFVDGERRSPNRWTRIARLEQAALPAGRNATLRQYRKGNQLIFTQTFDVGTQGFIASMSSRLDDNLLLLKSVVVEPARRGVGRQSVTAHWAVDGAQIGADTQFFADPTVISLTQEELVNMQRLLSDLLQSRSRRQENEGGAEDSVLETEGGAGDSVLEAEGGTGDSVLE